jgi:hypothetical protein
MCTGTWIGRLLVPVTDVEAYAIGRKKQERNKKETRKKQERNKKQTLLWFRALPSELDLGIAMIKYRYAPVQKLYRACLFGRQIWLACTPIYIGKQTAVRRARREGLDPADRTARRSSLAY